MHTKILSTTPMISWTAPHMMDKYGPKLIDLQHYHEIYYALVSLGYSSMMDVKLLTFDGLGSRNQNHSYY